MTVQGQAGTANRAEALRSTAVSANYFGLLGVAPELGRTFLDGED